MIKKEIKNRRTIRASAHYENYNLVSSKRSIRASAHYENYNLVSSKRSQVTLFVIIALVIVVLIAAIFLLKNQVQNKISLKENPSDYIRVLIQKCAEQAGMEAEKLVISHGGFLNPTNSLVFNGTNLSYLCWASQDLELCTNEHPLLNLEIQKEIDSYIKPKLEKCFSDVKTQLNNYGYSEGDLIISSSIELKEIRIKINKKISFKVNDNSVNLENFETKIISPLYDFIKITNEIINQELNCNCGVESCNAKTVELNKNNRDFDISKPVYTADGKEVYLIEELLTGKRFGFAIKNCVRT
jgi:hypothetical protein